MRIRWGEEISGEALKKYIQFQCSEWLHRGSAANQRSLRALFSDCVSEGCILMMLFLVYNLQLCPKSKHGLACSNRPRI